MCDRWGGAGSCIRSVLFRLAGSPIAVYPSTIHLKLSVQSRAPGLVPLFNVELNDHPLSIDQHNGISIDQWHEFAHQLLHS